GDIDVGEAADDARPGARRDDGGPRRERSAGGGDAEHAIALAQEAVNLVLLLDDDTEVARAGSDRGRAEVRVGVAVARRVGGAEQIVGVEIRAQGASGLRVEQLDLHAQALLERQAAPGDGQLVLVADQDQIAVLAEVGVDAELVTEALVGDDAVRGQLDTQAVRVLVADAAARERRGARADGVALEDDHRTHAEPGQMVGRAHAHDPGADDHDFSGFRHAATILQSRRGGDPMATLDPVWATVAELSHAFATRALSPVDVVDALMARISRRNPALHAYIAVYEAEARLAAEAADKAIRSGHRIGPLHGVPIALKDLVDLQGRVTTGGSKVWAERVSPVTATLAERLIAAGMIVLGKTHTVEFAMGSWGTNTHMGTPRNPWDLAVHRTPGGSSSGSGVAVSAGLAPVAIGTDPRDPQTFAWTPADPLPILRRGVEGLRLAVLPDVERTGVEKEVLAAYDAAVNALAGLGARIVQVEFPRRLSDYAGATGVIIGAEGYRFVGHLVDDGNMPTDPHVRPRIQLG